MSTKRILGITVFGVLFILALIGVMLLTSYIRRDYDSVPLPDTSAAAESPIAAEPDTLGRIEATCDTIQAIIATLSRPEEYRREVLIESFWEGGHTDYNISVSVAGGVTSLRTSSSTGVEKMIIVTPETLYIWYAGERTPYIGRADSLGDDLRTSDEYQMLITYEDILNLDRRDITDAGYTQYGGEYCVFAEYRSPYLGNSVKYYVSIELGLLIAAEEYDAAGSLIYRMTAFECLFDVDPASFLLPDGTSPVAD